MILFETPRTIVRRLELADVDDVFAWMSDPEVARYEYWEPYTRERVRAEVETQAAREPDAIGEWNEYAVELRSTGKVIGCLCLRLVDRTHRQAEVGFRFDPRHQGQGLATETARPLLARAFTLGAHRVFAVVDVRNRRCIALLDRLGMRREAHLRENCFVKGEWGDEYVYAILQREFAGAD